MMIVPKSGWPVLGQTAVNSGQVISISYSRSGNWFGKVSSRLTIGPLLDSVETAAGGHPLGPLPGPEKPATLTSTHPDDSTDNPARRRGQGPRERDGAETSSCRRSRISEVDPKSSPHSPSSKLIVPAIIGPHSGNTTHEPGRVHP